MREERTGPEVRQHVHARLLALRNLFTVVGSDNFLEAYERASREQRAHLWAMIEQGRQNELSLLVRKLLRTELESLTVRELRRVAQNYGVSGYQILPKSSLLSAIRHRERTEDEQAAAKAGRDGGPPPPGKGAEGQAVQTA